MPARRPPPNFTAESGRRLVEILTENQADLLRQFKQELDVVIDRVDNLKTSLQQDIRIVQQDVRIEGQARQALATELNHVADELGKVRDSIALKKVEETMAAAKVAVQEAVPAMQRAINRAPKKLQKPQWAAIILIAATFVVTLAEKAPPTMRFIEKTWTAWAGADK